PTLSDADAPSVIEPETVELSAGLVTATVGAVVSFETEKLTLDWDTLPAASRATATRTCPPAAVAVLSQFKLNGVDVTSPMLTPSSLNVTPTTPTLSAALAASG